MTSITLRRRDKYYLYPNAAESKDSNPPPMKSFSVFHFGSNDDKGETPPYTIKNFISKNEKKNH